MNAHKTTYLLSCMFLAACTSQAPMNQKWSDNSSPAVTLSKPIKEAPAVLTEDTVKSEKKGSSTEETVKQSTSSHGKTDKTSASHTPSAWNLAGAIAARSGKKGWTASINWQQSGTNAYQIRLSGPLGSGSVLIQKQGGVTQFRDGNKTDSSANANELLAKHTGIRLPVNSLYYWVRGIPAPGGVQSAQRDNANHLQVLRQNGYTVTYGGYQTVGNISLPSQIKLQGNGVFIKLVVKRWNF